MDRLFDELRALNDRLTADGIRIVIAGGFGLVLRETHLRRIGQEPRRPIPTAARSTDDLDLILGAEIIANGDQMKRIREVLDELGYAPAPGRENYQFVERERLERGERGIKIDLLGEPVPPSLTDKVKYEGGRRSRRVRARAYRGLHVHNTPEALTALDHAVEIPLGNASVLVPHPYSHVLLKLFALRDRMWEHGRVESGAYHAFDIYRILASVSRDEWREAEQLAATHRESDVVRIACRYVSQLFGDDSSQGALRIQAFARDSSGPLPRDVIRGTIDDLAALFPVENAAAPPADAGPSSCGFESAATLDDARRQLLRSLAAECARKRDTLGSEGIAALERLQKLTADRITTGPDLPARLLTEESWAGGHRWAAASDRDRRQEFAEFVDLVYGAG